MKIIILKPGLACKCNCRQYNGDDNKKYWYDGKCVFSTDCHKPNPIIALGVFGINSTTIIQKSK